MTRVSGSSDSSNEGASVKTWVPNRKVVSAFVSGAVTLVAFILLGHDIDPNLQASIVGAVMTLVGYLVPLPDAEDNNLG